MIGVVIDYLLFTIYYFFRVIRSWAELLRIFGTQTSAGNKYGASELCATKTAAVQDSQDYSEEPLKT